MKDITSSRERERYNERKSSTYSSFTSSCSHLRTKWPVYLIFTSLLFITIILFLKYLALDWIIDSKVAEKVRLVPDSDTWKKWTHIAVPIFLKFYLFNVTNPLEVMNGAKPKLQELGPFIYEEKRTKTILGVDKERDSVAYRQQIHYHFRQDLSNGSESDRVILINVPFVSVAKLARQMTNLSIAYGIADRSLRQRGERLFTFNTVKEYIFDGWSVQSYISFLSNPLLALVGGVQIPKSFSGGKFGFYRGKNGSDDGEIVVRTGITDPKEFGRIMSWNGQTKLSHWTGECNLINGTDGSILPPFITKKEILRFFVPDLCRSLLMIYGSDTVVEGINAYRFILPDPKKIFAQKGFCFCPKNKKYECYKTGVFSMSPCKESAPIAVSAPHFYQAYEPYLKAVEGLNPRKEVHDTFLDVEPKTGLVLRAAKRLQFNIMLEPNSFMPTFARVSETLFPFMWVEETAEMSEEYINEIKSQLIDSVQMASNISYGGLISCVFLLTLGLISCFITNTKCCGGNSEKLKNLDKISISSRSDSKNSLTRSESEESTTSSRSTMTMTSESKGTMTEDKKDEGYTNYQFILNE